MAGNINEFISSFSTTEFARPTNFEVNIPIPRGLSNKFNPTLTRFGDLKLRCEATELPGRTFSLVEQKTYGPVRFFPVQSAYDRIVLRFICSDDMFEKLLFDEWMSYISMAPDIGSSGGGTFGLIGRDQDYNFDYEYRDNYQSDITITQQNVEGKDTYKIVLYEAYPAFIQPMNLSWDNMNAIHKIDVMFSYRFWKNFSVNNQFK